MKNLESKLFFAYCFFYRDLGALFHAMQTGLIALGLIYNIVKYKDDFCNEYKKIQVLCSNPGHLYFIFSCSYLDYCDFRKICRAETGIRNFLKKKFLVFFIGSAVCYFVEKFCQFAVIEAIFTLFLYQCPDFQFGHAFFSSWRGRIGLLLHRLSCKILYASRFGGYQALFKW